MRTLSLIEMEYVSGGTEVPSVITQSDFNRFNAHLATIVNANANILYIVPQDPFGSDFAGNGATDWWNLIQALNLTYGLNPDIDFSDPSQQTRDNLLEGQRLENQYLAATSDTFDPFQMRPNSFGDAAARIHDQERAIYANQGDWFGVARVDLVFAAAAFDEFTQSGNPYYLGAAAVFGVLGVLETAIAGVLHVVDSIFSWLASLFGVEGDQPGSPTRPNNRDYTPEIDPGDELIADLQATRLRLPSTIGSQFGHYSPTAATVMQRFTMTGWDEWMMRYDPENYGRRIAGEVIP